MYKVLGPFFLQPFSCYFFSSLNFVLHYCENHCQFVMYARALVKIEHSSAKPFHSAHIYTVQLVLFM